MLSQEEQKFVDYWRENRDREKTFMRQLRAGLPVGLSLSAGILLCMFSGWDIHAMMVANTELNPFVLILAILLITVLFGVFYKKQKWEQNEQTYKELLHKDKKNQSIAN